MVPTPQNPSRKELHAKYEQPTINSWLQKLAITQHLRQTKTGKYTPWNKQSRNTGRKNGRNSGKRKKLLTQYAQTWEKRTRTIYILPTRETGTTTNL